MKFTKDHLKRIISEELSALSEIDNNEVAVQTAQYLASKAKSAKDQTNHINNSDQESILEHIHNLSQDMNQLILGLEPGIKGALTDLVAGVIAEVNRIMLLLPEEEA
jgi:hypothetical protein